jgi:hypothetical protein
MTPLVPIADIVTFSSTRNALHQVAEHVVAKARYIDDGEIRLMAFAGGFATPLLADDRRIRIEANEVVIDDRDGSRSMGLTTIDEAAAFVGVVPGFPTELYPAATALHPSQALDIERDAAAALAAWFGFTAEVLDGFAAEIAAANPSPLILWPEHFDQAFFTEDADESSRANYGASPGDEGHPEPYLYVGPWGTVAGNEFWNAAHFNGAVLPLSSLVAAADPAEVALQFLRTGRVLLTPR